MSQYDTRLAAYAVIVDDQDRLLLALWNEGPQPLWSMPGGGVELDEPILTGLVREVREETGYEVEPGRLLGVDTWVEGPAERIPASDRPLKNVRVLWTAKVVGGELAAEIGGTTDEARWIPLAEVPTLARVPLVDISLEMLTTSP